MNTLRFGYTHRSAANSLLKSTRIYNSFAGSDGRRSPKHPLTHTHSGSLQASLPETC